MPKKLIEGQTFTGQSIYIDKALYRNCTFIDCELIYTGDEWSLDGCHFERFVLNFEGAADRTLLFLSWLCAHEGTARSVAETIMERIRATRGVTGKGN